MALEQMEGFELAGRTVCVLFLPRLACFDIPPSFVSTLSTRKEQRGIRNKIRWTKRVVSNKKLWNLGESYAFLGGNLNAASRQALMQKLARIEPVPSRPEPSWVFHGLFFYSFTLLCLYSSKPNIPQAMQSRSVLLKNMFDPEECVIAVDPITFLLK